jgi:DNA-binding LacI/PurR family transcriptional regulator
MTAEPKHREISRQLLAEISMGKYAASGRLPSEPQLVKRFKVSRPTIARALRDLQAEGLIERRAGSGTFVNRQETPSRATRQLGLLIPELGTIEIFGIICGELASLARAHDYTLLWGDSAHPSQNQNVSVEDAVQLCEQFIEHNVAGVFFAPFELTGHKEEAREASRSILERFERSGVPVVLLDRDFKPFPQRSNFDLVSVDNVAAGWLLAEHLLKLGCRRIAFVAMPDMAPTVEARIAGVRATLVRERLELRPDWVQTGDPQDPKFVRSLTAGGRWDAVICANDLTAAHLLRSLEAIKIRVPRDLRLVGFDDAKYASLLSVRLTTMHQPCRDIAITAYRAMVERIAEPTLPVRSFLLNPRLVIRESCGAYLPGKGK